MMASRAVKYRTVPVAGLSADCETVADNEMTIVGNGGVESICNLQLEIVLHSHTDGDAPRVSKCCETALMHEHECQSVNKHNHSNLTCCFCKWALRSTVVLVIV